MKDLVSCFSEHAVRISDVACSGSGAANAAAGAPAASAVTTVYRSRLSASGKELLIEVTWSRAPDGPALSVAVHEAGRHPAAGAAAPRHLHRKKGTGTFTAGSCVVGVFWDYTAAHYAAGAGAGAGPEPAAGFYVAVVADAEFALLLGDLSRAYVDRLHAGIPVVAAGSPRAARRRERFVGGCGCWSARARFLEAGAEHEVGVVLLDGDAEARVTVDGRKVAQLRRLRWNFRGSHTIFLDGGAPLDMTWDLHGWLFHADPSPPHHAHCSSSAPCAVFTFQARGASDTRMWADYDGGGSGFTDGEEAEKPQATAGGRRQKPGGGGAAGQGFCLLIQGFRGFSKST
ncbi:hypothetical protein BS78_06G082700 [Paspalum vaginatum]|nr:hypothetical protein BS78_06G082700 [Paspalum vaginatum]